MMKAVGIVFSNIHDDEIPELVAKRTFGSIPFGGRYRLIDFVLSNMVNSGITTVGVITKSNYQSLMDHVGNGKDWDLARKDGGLILLPPFGTAQHNVDGLYTSRLTALKSITNFINRADEEFVVMSDCNNVCRMNYSEVIKKHIECGADVTLVYTKRPPKAEVMKNAVSLAINESGRITSIDFEEEMKGGNMFMNVYVMRKSLLQRFVMDSFAHHHTHFTTEILADSVKSLKIYGYEHQGFSACIDSMQSYYEKSLELLDKEKRHELFGMMDIYTKVKDSPPTRFGASAIVKNSLIADGCVIEGQVENSILFRDVKVGRGTVIKNSILMQNTMTGDNVTLNAIIADKNVVIKDMRVLSGAVNHPFYISKGTLI